MTHTLRSLSLPRPIGAALLRTAACAAMALLTTTAKAQWTLYPSYADITEIAPAGSKTFVLASGNLYAYAPDGERLTTYDKTNLLSDVGISHIAWSQEARRLVVVYDNANIDLLTIDDERTNVSGIYKKDNLMGKTINSITFSGRYAYLATGFGIAKVNLTEGTISETYQLGFAVDYCYVQDGYLYAASKEQGLYRASLSTNLLDAANWTRTGGYVARAENKTTVTDATTGYTWTVTDTGLLTYYKTDADGNRTYLTSGIKPEGPASNHFYRLYIHNGTLYGVAGQWSQDIDAAYEGEVHVWDGQQWREFEQPTAEQIGHSYVDLLSLDFDPADASHVMVGAKSGIYEFRNERFVGHFSRDNSPLQSSISDASGLNYTIVPSVKYASDGTLWLLNAHVDNPLRSYNATTSTWQTYSNATLNSHDYHYDTGNLHFSTTNNLIWFTNKFYQKSLVVAYNHSSDAWLVVGPSFVNQDGTNIEIDYINDLTEDKDGNIWLATDAGPCYIAPSDLSLPTPPLTQYKVARNDGTNLADYLMAGSDIRCIAIDGGNRKWMGTNGQGVFLISADNDTQEANFTAENSPLLSNFINDITIDQASGTVFIATDKGLCAYQSGITEPAEEMDKDNVYAYPNPVTPDYSGMITIVGLSYDADVKIVTANGTLVNEGRSLGGSYTWNGCDLNGRRVASGVYMVEAATSEGKKGVVCKVAVVR